MTSPIHVGVGGWNYEPWRTSFYPSGLRKADALAHLSRRLTMTEVNATFYRTQTRATFEAWAAATPPGFRFALKAPRYIVAARELAGKAEQIGFFMDSGIDALGDKLGPVLWQFAATKRFDERDVAGFLALLPRAVGGVPLLHALEPRHASFDTPAFHALAAEHGCAVVIADDDEYPNIGTGEGPFVYARLQRCRGECATGYPDDELDSVAAHARAWAAEGRPTHLLFIAGAKERAPLAAEALIARL